MRSHAKNNPFRETRFEYEGQPLIWRTQLSKRIWTVQKNVYVRGSRGSGKTSLLQSVDIGQILTNRTLSKQYEKEELQVLGFYCRLPLAIPSALEGIKSAEIQGGPAAATTLMVRVFWRILYAHFWTSILERLHSLKSSAFADLTAAEENDICLDLLSMFSAHGVTFNPTGFLTFSKLQASWRSYGEKIHAAADFLDIPFLYQSAANFGNASAAFVEVGKTLKEIFRQSRLNLSTDPTVLFMLDEFDRLTPTLQVALNTLVRDTRYPVFWAPAFISFGVDTTSTLSDRIFLSEADRDVIDLDILERQEYEDLCLNVASVRLYYRCLDLPPSKTEKPLVQPTDDPRTFFKFRSRLGSPSLNAIMNEKLRSSAKGSKTASELWQLAANLQNIHESKVKSPILEHADFEVKSGDPPLLQALLVQKNVISESEFALRGSNEEAFRAAVRRKLRGAFLVAVRTFKWRPMPFAGARVALGLSDHCIRDFLDIMAALYDLHASKTDRNALKSFCISPHEIGIEQQAKAFDWASDDKVRALKDRSDNDGRALYNLIAFLGQLTWDLQTNEALGALDTPERGIFVIDFAELDLLNSTDKADIDFAKKILNQAISDGHLKILFREKRLKSTEKEAPGEYNVLRVRLHRRFAPQFFFSYLGALEEVKLPANLLVQVCSDPNIDVTSMSSNAARMMASIRQNSLHKSTWDSSGQLRLPLEDDTDDANEY